MPEPLLLCNPARYFHAKLSDKYPLFFTNLSYLAQCSLSNSTSVNSFCSEKTR